MRSAAKLSYEQAQAAIDGRPDDTTGPLLDAVLKPLWAAYAALKRGPRRSAQPLDLDLPERKIVLDRGRHRRPRRSCPERLDAHRLIEEFMIQANVAAAETLETGARRCVYRVHDAAATPRRSMRLREFLQSLDMSLPKARRAAGRAVQPHPGARQGHATSRSWSTRWCCARRRRPNIRAENYRPFRPQPRAATPISPRRSAAMPT